MMRVRAMAADDQSSTNPCMPYVANASPLAERSSAMLRRSWGSTVRKPPDGENTVSSDCQVFVATSEPTLVKIAALKGLREAATTRATRDGTGHARTAPRTSPEMMNGYSAVGGVRAVSRK